MHDHLSDEEINQVYLKVFGKVPPSMTINHSTINTGEQVVEKHIVYGDNIGGVVGSGVVNARDITVFKDHLDGSRILDGEAKKSLLEARSALENAKLSIADKHDVADHLGTLTAELEKPTKEVGVINSTAEFRRRRTATPRRTLVFASSAPVSSSRCGGSGASTPSARRSAVSATVRGTRGTS